MKDLKAFLETASKDEALAKKVGGAKSTEELLAIASDNGFKFSEDDLMDVSGGGAYFDNINANFNLDFSKFDQTFNQNFNVSGTGNTTQASAQVNFGSKG